SYDLLVPLMLAEGIAFVALRKRSLYTAQLPAKSASPGHETTMDVLKAILVRDVMTHSRPFISFRPNTPTREIVRQVSETTWQDIFPVLDDDDKMVGMITEDALRVIASEQDLAPLTLAVDAMRPPLTVRALDDLRAATEAMLANGVREVPVADEQ